MTSHQMSADALNLVVSSLPASRPFTRAEALERGVSSTQLRRVVEAGLLVHPMRGFFYRSTIEDSLELRLSCLRLVVPEDCVITDRTAAWLWGAETALAPNDHLAVPRVSVFCPPGRRLRNSLARSGERGLARHDVSELDGLRVTTPLRTACDLGRLLHQDQALAAMDALAALRKFSVEELLLEAGRFKGYRGVLQLRLLAPLVEPQTQSPGESILRLRWIQAGLPRPTAQLRVPSATGGWWYLDLGLESERFAAEYDGVAHHSSPADVRHDGLRRGYLREHGWTIVVADGASMFGPRADVEHRLRAAWQAHVTRQLR